MEIIGTIVKTIVVLAFLALFLDVLLPEGSMKKYAKFIMGLLIVLAIINPVLGLFQADLPSISVNTWDEVPANTEKILADGKNLSNDMTEQGVQEYQQSMIKQIKALVKLVDGVDQAVVEVFLNEQNNLTGVTIVLTIEEQAVTNMVDANQDQLIKDIRLKVEETINDFYNIPSDKIQVSIGSYAN